MKEIKNRIGKAFRLPHDIVLRIASKFMRICQERYPESTIKCYYEEDAEADDLLFRYSNTIADTSLIVTSDSDILLPIYDVKIISTRLQWQITRNYSLDIDRFKLMVCFALTGSDNVEKIKGLVFII